MNANMHSLILSLLLIGCDKLLRVAAALTSHNDGLQPGIISQINPFSLKLLRQGVLL